MSESKLGRPGAVLFAFLAALAACTSSSPGAGTADGSTPAAHVNCIVSGRSGDPSSCSLFGSCSNVLYAVDCSAMGCVCQKMEGDAGLVKGKMVPFDPLYCADGDAGTLSDRLTYRIDDALAAANSACGWGLH